MDNTSFSISRNHSSDTNGDSRQRAMDTESTIIDVSQSRYNDHDNDATSSAHDDHSPVNDANSENPQEGGDASSDHPHEEISRHESFVRFLKGLSASYPLPHEFLLFPLSYLLFYFSYGSTTATNRSVDANGKWCEERFYSFYERREQMGVLRDIARGERTPEPFPSSSHAQRRDSNAISGMVLPPSSDSSAVTEASTLSQLPLLLPLHRMHISSFICGAHSAWGVAFLQFLQLVLYCITSITSSLFQFFNNWIDFVFLIVMYLQLVSHILVPVLSWSKISTRWLVRLAFFRSFQLEMLFLDPIDFQHPIDHNTALWMNFYGPLIGSFLYLTLLYINFAHCCLLTFLTRHKVVEQFTGVKYWYMRLSFVSLNSLFRLLPILFMPVLNAFFLAITCNLNWHVRLEVIPQNCWSATNFGFALASLCSLIPFIAITLLGVSVTNDWRPDTRNVCGRPHTRYDLITFAICTLIAFMSSFLETLTIFLLFIDFTLILILIGLHIYFMQWYKTFVNQLVCTFLIVTMFGCMISLLISAFHFIFSFFEFSFTNFPGAMLFASLPVSFVLGMKLTMLRLNVIRLSLSPLTAPRPLQLLYSIEPNDVIVPRGEFEIEMASRSLPIVRSMIFDAPAARKVRKRFSYRSLLISGRGGARISPRTQDDNDVLFKPSEEETFMHEQEERVRDMIQNSLDMASHARSEYVHISFASYQAHVMNDLRQALHLAEICQTDHTVLWPDFRLMYYVRQRYWRLMLDFRQKNLLRASNHSDAPSVEDGAEAVGIDLRSLTELHQRRTHAMADEARQQREAGTTV
mmetsp:Transcript_8306/g.30660  ORF Transcript_8306/g.30660 Transcript_8306/m.30660 type:complete len:805 (-) Transcript_8306:2316-4730(-)